MNRKWLGFSVLGLLLLSLWLPGVAQMDATFGNLRVKVGAFFPTEDELRDFNKTWFAVGAAYTLPAIPLLGGNTELSVDVFSHSTGGSRGTVVPITLNQVYSQTNVTGFTTRLGFGIGAYVVDAIGASKTVFGGRVSLSLMPNETFSVEVAYDYTDRFRGGIRANGVSAMLTYRF